MSSKTWASATARRIGAGSEFDFTPTRVGCTLHLPCRGWGRNHPPHMVDVTIPPGQNPEAVAKKLMQAGWTVGSRLKCPNKPEKRKAETMDKETRAIGMSGTSKGVLAATMPPVAANAEEVEVLVISVQEEKLSPSQAAGRGKRLAYMALEDYYDEAKRLYRPGHTDASIAKQCGLSETVVRSIREEAYGPLAEPNEIAAFRAELAADKAAFDEAKRQALAAVTAAATTYCKAVESIDRRLSAIARKNGWSEV